MSRNYKIILLEGNHPSVVNIIGPFAMDPNVIREMDGYPILTDADTFWFVAMKGTKVLGFSAIKKMKNHLIFTYGYIHPEQRGNKIYNSLIEENIKWAIKTGIPKIKADCTSKSLGLFKKKGFKVVKEFKHWTKVEKDL